MELVLDIYKKYVDESVFKYNTLLRTGVERFNTFLSNISRPIIQQRFYLAFLVLSSFLYKFVIINPDKIKMNKFIEKMEIK